MMLPRTAYGKRPGFSLLEVLVATAIFLLALVGIGQLITLGGDRALEVQQQSQAIRLCQSKMAEVIAGVVPLGAQTDAPFDEDPDWTWSMEAEQQGDAASLWTVTIKVTRAGQDNRTVVAALSQVVLDPSQRGSTLDITAAAQAAAQAQSSSSANNSNSANANSNTANANQQPQGNTGMAGGKTPGKTTSPAPSPGPAPKTPTPSPSPKGGSPTKGG